MVLLLFALSGCASDQGLAQTGTVGSVVEAFGGVKGRVCDPEASVWLEGATVYTNLYDRTGRLYDTRQTTTNALGEWQLDELPADVTYTVYVQLGLTILEAWNVTIEADRVIELPEPDCLDIANLDVAVITGNYDDFARVLESVGIYDYTLVDGEDELVLSGFLTDLDAMLAYDVIVFDGGHVEEGILYDSRDPSNPVPGQVIDNVRAFVAAGGNVLATDWSYDVVEEAWPEKIDFLGVDEVPNAAQRGNVQTVQAYLVDQQLAAFVGAPDGFITLNYDLPIWPPIESVSNTVSVHVDGTITYWDNGVDVPLAGSPILVSFNGGGGRVVYSTFRFSANTTDDVVDIARYIMARF